MSLTDLQAMAPLVITALAAVIVMLAIAIRRSHRLAAALSLAALAAAALSLPYAARAGQHDAVAVGHQTLLVIDGYALLIIALILAASAAVVLLSYSYLQCRAGRRKEYYVLLLLATLGAQVLAAANHFAVFFLAFEMLSVPLFALIAYQRDSRAGVEAGLKYLVLAGVSSAFLLMGMALVYLQTGTMEFTALGRAMSFEAATPLLVLVGVGLMIVGVGFKLAVAPFHLWTADVYQGAPAPVTAFIATVSKGGIFAVALRWFATMNLQSRPAVLAVVVTLAAASMLVGNLLALRQQSLKRLLAYSSIAQMGYLLIALAVGTPQATAAAVFFLAAYFASTLGAFGFIAVLSGPERACQGEAQRSLDADTLSEFRGLAWRRPGLAVAITVTMLSLAGIPLTGGFFGKLYIVAAGVAAGAWALVVLLAVASAIGLYYYLRVVAAIYAQPEGPASNASSSDAPAAAPGPLAAQRGQECPRYYGSLVLSVLAIVLIYIGALPGPLTDLIHRILTMR